MRKTLLVLVLGLAVVAFVAAGCGGDDEEGAGTTETTETTGTGTETGEQELYGSVGPGFVISLKTEDGSDVTSVPAGEYTIEVNDQADIHDFHLAGPGVDESTGVAEEGKTTWTVELQDGEYTFVCDPHSSQMNGSFTVTG